MPHGSQQLSADEAVAAGSLENGRLSESQLTGTKNPALARLAGAVRDQSTSDPAENYSRMHHRHNRS
jgi:hypothetical protein